MDPKLRYLFIILLLFLCGFPLRRFLCLWSLLLSNVRLLFGLLELLQLFPLFLSLILLSGFPLCLLHGQLVPFFLLLAQPARLPNCLLRRCGDRRLPSRCHRQSFCVACGVSVPDTSRFSVLGIVVLAAFLFAQWREKEAGRMNRPVP